MVTHCCNRIHCWLMSVFFAGILLSGCASDPNRETPGLMTDSMQLTGTGEVCDEPLDATKLDARHLIDPLGLDRRTDKAQTDPQDLWERVRLGFRLEIPNDWRVRRELSRIVANPGSLESGVKRAEPYLHFIVNEAEKRNMPLELALLPAVESGFKPSARSPKEAAGLWQFIPSTAKEKGLKQNQWYEGRCDITASTRAALDYLQELADIFEGDWELALAAYNAGPGRVQRAIQANQEKGLETDFWSLPLPTETRNYVPKLLAIARVLQNPEYHGVNVKPLPNAPYFREVMLSKPMPMHQAAKLANVDPATLSKLNPGIRRGIAGLGGHYPLLLPAKRVAEFEERLAQLESGHWANLRQVLPRYRNYRVRPGDGVTQIAQQFGITSSELRAANSLNDWQLRAGQNLVIPATPATPATPSVVASAQAKDSLPTHPVPVPQATKSWVKVAPNDSKIVATELKTELVAAKSVPQLPASSNTTGNTPLTHVVQPREFLMGIARRYQIDHAQLAAWNNLSSKTGLIKGQVLRLHPPSSNAENKSFIYEVHKGDSLQQIAERFKVSIVDLRRWNRLAKDEIRPGTQLRLHPSASLTASF